ncbi:MAG: phosphoglycerate kinase, partial [Dehalococcoidia bacterium]|nr:phosphoglycerate kinase [Dehalococcoidia bacterium]
MSKMTVADIDVAGKRVLVRVDFNVPVDPETGAILNDSRIRGALPTLSYLISKGAKVILVTHFGRPAGKVVESMRLDKIAVRLQELLGKPVRKIDTVIGPEAEQAAAA